MSDKTVLQALQELTLRDLNTFLYVGAVTVFLWLVLVLVTIAIGTWILNRFWPESK